MAGSREAVPNSLPGPVDVLPSLLHPSLCEDVTFLPYLTPTFQDGGDVDPLWVEAVQQLDSDLHWLLRLPHSKFWSQMVFDSSLQKSLDSYLRHAPRSYDRPLNLPLKVREFQRNVYKRVFMTFLRLSTAKESETHHFSPAVHADLIYKYYLFDLPKLMDLCALYASSNKPLLTKMVANVFKVQPSYTEDWSLSVQSFAKILKKVSDKVLPAQGAVLLTDPPKSLPADELTDLILYLSDTTSTLGGFLDVYPPAVGGLLQGGFLETLVNFYESVVPVLQREWLEARGRVTNAPHVKARFRQFKQDSAWIVNSILRLYFDPTTGESDESSHISLDGFITAVTLVLTEKTFLREFEKHYSLSSLVHEMQQLHPDLPQSHFDYIVSSLEPEVKEKPRADLPTDTSKRLVSQVKELLPHLGEGFIELCLKEFGNSPETVVDRVLEGNLPAHLKEVDQSASVEDVRQRSSQAKAESTQSSGKGSSDEKAGFLEERLNVYDNDDFDVFSKDVSVDLSRVHFGKRFTPSSASGVFNDKAHLSKTRGTYRQYEVEVGWAYQGPGGGEGLPGVMEGEYEFDQYSDEYDDTYDSHVVGAADNDSSEELFTVRRLNDKGKFSQHFSQFRTSGDEDNEPRSGASHVTITPGNVTILQREHKEHLASKPKTTSQSPRKSQASKGQSSKSPSADNKPVESERARHLKEKNKAKRANHNRKAMADKKRSRGMGAPPRQ